MSMMQMLMASHISEGLGPVPPIPVEDKPWLTEEVDKGTVVRRAVKERLTPMGSQPGCIHQTARLCFDSEQPITAVRAWLIDNVGESGEPVITSLAFRYRGSSRFIPDGPDAADDAARRGRDSSLSSCLARASDAASALARLGRCIAVATSCWVLSSLNLLPKGCPRRLRCCPLSPGQCRGAVLAEGLRLGPVICCGIAGAAR